MSVVWSTDVDVDVQLELHHDQEWSLLVYAKRGTIDETVDRYVLANRVVDRLFQALVRDRVERGPLTSIGQLLAPGQPVATVDLVQAAAMPLEDIHVLADVMDMPAEKVRFVIRLAENRLAGRFKVTEP